MLLALVVAACGGSASTTGGGDAAVCMRSDPACPSTVPSYATTVHPILVQACVTCHYPGSGSAESPLATYEQVHLVFGATLGQVSSCLMPPPGSPPLTEDERAALLAWLACGGPEN